MPALLAASAVALAGCGDSSEPEPTVTTIGPVETVEPAEPAESGEVTIQLVADYEGTRPYPMDTCLVSDEDLGSMGSPIVMAYGDQQVKFCCASCKPKFTADPQKYLDKIDAAAAAQAAEPATDDAEGATQPAADEAADESTETSELPADVRPYPLSVCLVSGEPLGDSPISVVYGKQEVKFCCADCKPDFMDDPQAYLSKLASSNIDPESDTGKMINTGLDAFKKK